MKILLILGVVALCALSTSNGFDLYVGTNYNTRLKWHSKVEYMGIIFKKRVKEVFYSDPEQQIIKSIIARESEHTEATVSITAGGVGFTYANLRFKSERGSGLYYQVEVYV